MATTRSGALLYLLARVSPRGMIDRMISRVLRARAREGHFDRSALARDFVERLRA